MALESHALPSPLYRGERTRLVLLGDREQGQGS